MNVYQLTLLVLLYTVVTFLISCVSATLEELSRVFPDPAPIDRIVEIEDITTTASGGNSSPYAAAKATIEGSTIIISGITNRLDSAIGETLKISIADKESPAAYTVSPVSIDIPVAALNPAGTNAENIMLENTMFTITPVGDGEAIVYGIELRLEAFVLTAAGLSGTGTSADPYIIDNDRKLNLVAELVNANTSNYRTAHYRVTERIDLGIADAPWSKASGSSGFMPIGRHNTNFAGTVDCQSNEIANLYINKDTTDFIGLFRFIEGATIKNCFLTDVEVIGRNYVGGLVGASGGSSGSTISNSHATGTVGGTQWVGGLVGQNGGGSTITTSYATSAVTASNENVGGLVGRNAGSIINSYASGAVTATTGTGIGVGGLVGGNAASAAISNSYASGSVTGNEKWSGGLVGWNEGSIVDSYATGTVEGSNQVGGLAGLNWNSSISNSYASGSVTGINQVGGLVGQNGGGSTITTSYATGAVTGSNENVGGLVGRNSRGSISNSYATGAVTGRGWIGGLVGASSNSTISNSYATGAVTASNTKAGGLAGYNYGSIRNSYATGAVTADIDVGGLVGANDAGAISNSYASGDVTGIGNNADSKAGGLVGGNGGSAAIINSYASGSVTGRNMIGGLVGRSWGSISNSYAVGAVTGSTGSTKIGGLVGTNGGSATVTYSYWDSTTTGQTTSIGGTAQTTAQMTGATASGATDSDVYFNWDAATIWSFASGRYPILQSVVCPMRQSDPTVDCP